MLVLQHIITQFKMFYFSEFHGFYHIKNLKISEFWILNFPPLSTVKLVWFFSQKFIF